MRRKMDKVKKRRMHCVMRMMKGPHIITVESEEREKEVSTTTMRMVRRMKNGMRTGRRKVLKKMER